MSDRQGLIERYRQGHAAVLAALEGATEEELDLRAGPDQWTAREVVHHLADSEMTSAIRLRRLLCEEEPLIGGYDEAEFACRLRYSERPIASGLRALEAARSTSAEILEGLEEADWERSGTHSESGHYSVRTWLEIYAAHAHQIARARTRARASQHGSA